jgi:altronate hydrolase
MSEVMSRPAAKTLLLNPADNVAVALSNLDAGMETPQGVVTSKRVPRGHKFSVRPIASGEAVVKFGQIIGFAKDAIPAGEWVHEHNCGIGEEQGAFERDYAYGEGVVPWISCRRASRQRSRVSSGRMGRWERATT